MSVTLNGHTYSTATNFTGASGRAYNETNADTSLTNFPESIFTDLLVELAKASSLDVYVEGSPFASEAVLRKVYTHAVTFPVGMTLSKASAATAATASTVFSIKKNGVEFATATFAISGTTATFACASATSFAAGDVLTLVAPASPDATLADVAFALTWSSV